MGNEQTIDKNMPNLTTVKEVVLHGAEYGKDKRQYIYHDNEGIEREKSFNEVKYMYVGLGQHLYSKSINNAYVAILGEKSFEWIVCYFSSVTSTNITVPIDALLPDEDLIDVLLRSDTDVLYYSNEYSATVEKLKETEGIKIKLYLKIEELDTYISEGYASLEKGDKSYLEDEVLPDDVACITFTSGTTGKSKGIMLTHKNITTNLLASNSVLSGGHAIGFLPLHHTYSWISSLFSGCLLAEWGYICKSIKDIHKAIITYKPYNFSAVPLAVETMYKRIWQAVEKSGNTRKLKIGLKISRFLMKLGIDRRRKIFKQIIDNLGGNLDMIPCGAAYLDPVYEQGMYDFGIQIINGYGLSECSPVVTCNRRENFKVGSVGLPIPCNEIKINEPDEDGIGEICVRGTNVMVGYYKDPEATAEVFDGDWLKTGDYGRIDEDGFLFFVGRKKNLMVLSNGKNISPEEIEDKIMSSISYVKEVVVYQEKDSIVAEFFLDTEAEPDAKQKIREDVNAVNRTLPGYKQITQIKTRDTEFPKTTTLKILRKYND